MDTDRRLPEIRPAFQARLRNAGGGNRKVYYTETVTSYALCTVGISDGSLQIIGSCLAISSKAARGGRTNISC